jgi:hypothetical protein
MRQKQWLNYTGKFLAVGILSISSLWVLKPEAAIAWGENCNVFGCSESPGVDCNTFGCPKPGAQACTPLGCPDPLPSKPDDGSNRPDDRGSRNRQEKQADDNGDSSGDDRPVSAACMDRIMYVEVRAESGPDAFGYYRYNLPTDLTGDQISKAGFRFSSSPYNAYKKPVVRIQVKSPEEAAKACR